MENESTFPEPQAAIAIPAADNTVSEPDTHDNAVSSAVPWSWTKKVAFRFALVYFVLYAFPFPIGVLPFTETLGSYYDLPWRVIASWVARHLLHLSYPLSFAPTGSGDTTYSWVLNLIYLVLAIAGCVIWSVLDRKRRNYDRLHNWLRLYVRVYVGAIMMSYGAYKVIQSQFPPPPLSRLVQPYGESSPMGLLWTFMGNSYTYNLFTGGAEIVGGALLLIPPLATLGALITIAVMGNVFILNMSYDVPVKLFSFNAIVMAAFIALPDAGRLLNVFVLNEPTQPAPPRPLFQRVRLNDAMRWLQLLLLVVFLSFSLFQSWQQFISFRTAAVPSEIRGIWTVHDFTFDGQPRPPSMSDARRWQRVIFEYTRSVGVQFMDAPFERYGMQLDPTHRDLKLVARDDPNWKGHLNYELPEPQLMLLKGELDGHQVEMKLQRKDLSEFRLLNRGFHWISEAPFNR